MVQYVHNRLDENGKVELEMKEVASLYSTDVISSCAFGIEANSLENPDSEFKKAGTAMFKMSVKRAIEFTSFFMIPQIMKFFNFLVFSPESTKFVYSTMP
jgi:cytochrome P450 family 6